MKLSCCAIARRAAIAGALLSAGLVSPTPAVAIDTNFTAAMRALDDVRVTSFTSLPATIGPFGSSRIAWTVSGRDDLIDLELNGQAVPFSGSRVVTPRSTTIYALVAKAHSRRVTIGSARIAVDRSTCRTELLSGTESLIEGAVQQSIERPIYIRRTFWRDGAPDVTFERGYIRIRMLLGKDVDKAPNPSISIDARFDLTVDQSGALRANRRIVGVKASLPDWADWYPGVSEKLRAGEREAKALLLTGIDELVALLNFLYFEEPGMRRQDVVIRDDGIHVTQCPSPSARTAGPDLVAAKR